MLKQVQHDKKQKNKEIREVKKKLKEICTIEKGQQIDTRLLDNSNTYRYINGGIKESGFFNDYNTEGETVLISEGGASCGYVNYVNEKFWCGCHCYRLSDISIFPKYLFYSLKASQQALMDLRTGAAMPNIKKETLKNFELTVCDSLPKQQKIAKVLDTIQSAIDNKKQQLACLEELVKSKFVEMFGENPVESGKWKVETLGEVADVRDGTHDSPAYYSAGYPFITTKNLVDGKIDFLTASFICEEDYKHFDKRSHVDDGDILMPMIGTIGGAILVNKDRDFAIKNVALIKRIQISILNFSYLLIFLNSDFMSSNFEQFKTGGTQKFISLTFIRNLKIPVPPIELQNTFATFVQKVDNAKELIKAQLKDLSELLESRMDFYFGE